MALLVLMEAWAARGDLRLSAVTVDHGLRPEAAGEAVRVAAFCAGRGIPHETLKWKGWDGRGNLQAAARAARYRLIADWARGRGVEAVCLGHTQDDQAETFLMRLGRKAGSDGLRAMAADFERDGMRWVRPLLGVARGTLRAHLEERGIAWVEDPSNADAGFDRVKARKALGALAPLGIGAEELSAVARNLAAENALIRQVVREKLAGTVREELGALSLDEAAYRDLPLEVRRRFLRAAAGWIAGGEYGVRDAALGDLLAALEAGGTHVAGGMIGWVTRGRVWLAREHGAVRGMCDGLFDGRWRIDAVPEGCEIRALGEAGLNQVPDWREIGVPRRVLLPLPALWQRDEMRACPPLDTKNRCNAVLVAGSFANRLGEH